MYFYLPAAVVRLRRFKPDVIFLSEILPLVGLFLKWFTGSNVATAYGDWHFHNLFGRKTVGQAAAEGRRSPRPFRSAPARRLLLPGRRGRRTRPALGHPGGPCPRGPRRARPGSLLSARCTGTCATVADSATTTSSLLYHGVMHPGKGLDKLMIWTNELYRENRGIGLDPGRRRAGASTTARARRDACRSARRIFFTGWLKTIQGSRRLLQRGRHLHRHEDEGRGERPRGARAPCSTPWPAGRSSSAPA